MSTNDCLSANEMDNPFYLSKSDWINSFCDCPYIMRGGGGHDIINSLLEKNWKIPKKIDKKSHKEKTGQKLPATKTLQKLMINPNDIFV